VAGLVPAVELKGFRTPQHSLNDIEHPLNLIPKTPAGNYSEPYDFESNEEGFNSDHSSSKLDDMEDNNDRNEERGKSS
jgi:hypothetical protein